MTDSDSDADDGSDSDLRLTYGQPAEAVGEPDMRFGRLSGDYVLVPEQVLNWSMVEENEVAPGEIDISALSANGRGLLFKKLEPTELDELAARLRHGTQLTDQEARVVVLFSGLEYDREEIAAELDIPESAVEECIRSVEDRYDREQVIADLQEHTDLTEREAEVFTLAETFDYDREEIAAELDIPGSAVEDHLRTIREEHDLEETVDDLLE